MMHRKIAMCLSKVQMYDCALSDAISLSMSTLHCISLRKQRSVVMSSFINFHKHIMGEDYQKTLMCNIRSCDLNFDLLYNHFVSSLTLRSMLRNDGVLSMF